MPANDNQVFQGREFLRHVLVKTSTLWSHQHDPARLRAERFDRGKDRLRLHDHSLPATERRVIHHMVAIICPIAQVMNLQHDGTGILCAAHHTLTQRHPAKLREKGDDVDPHALMLVLLRRHRWRRFVAKFAMPDLATGMSDVASDP